MKKAYLLLSDQECLFANLWKIFTNIEGYNGQSVGITGENQEEPRGPHQNSTEKSSWAGTVSPTMPGPGHLIQTYTYKVPRAVLSTTIKAQKLIPELSLWTIFPTGHHYS